MQEKKDFKKIKDFLWEIPKTYRAGMRVPVRVYASEKILNDILKDRSIQQLINGATLPGIIKYTIAMPDCHEGYSVPIGFVGATDSLSGVISPGACGFDINCGVRLLKSECRYQEVKDYLERLINEIEKNIPSGLGNSRKVKLNINNVNKILEEGVIGIVNQGFGEKEDIENCESKGRLIWADSSAVSSHAKARGQNQVGTLGSGNHFLELQIVEKIFDKEKADIFGLFQDQVVVMIHCGSRGLGHQVCSDYLKEFIPLTFNKYKIKVSNKELACVPFQSKEGQRYFKAMAASANYAWVNRQMITYFIRKAWRNVLGTNNSSLNLLYDVAHNIIKIEQYFIDNQNTEVVIHRKGATRAFPSGHPEIPVMYQKTGQPVLIPGSMGTASYILSGTKKGEEAFYSTSHGAGRTMSRHAARKATTGQKTIKDLQSKGIIIKCKSVSGVAEESPMAYKDIDKVIDVINETGLSKKVARLKPLAVIKGE